MAHTPDYSEMGQISFPLAHAYAQKHGYRMAYDPAVEQTLADACKISLFHELYATGEYGGDDVFFWLDTDALIMNSDVKLERYIHEMGEAHVMYGSDANGINSGTWFARFTSRADHFLRVSQQMSFALGWSDQPGIFQTFLQPVFQPWVKIVPGKGFNSMPYNVLGWNFPHGTEVNAYEPGDLVCHFPGIEHQTRMALMREYAELAK